MRYVKAVAHFAYAFVLLSTYLLRLFPPMSVGLRVFVSSYISVSFNYT